MKKQEFKTIAALGTIFAFRMLGLFMILPVFSLFAEKLPGATPTLTGLALGIYGLTQAALQLPFGIWSDFISRKKVISIGLIIFALGSIFSALSHNIYALIIGRGLQGAGAIGSTTIALVGDLTSEKNRTTAMAIVGLMIGGSFITAIIVGPPLAQSINISGIFWLTAGLALFGLFILWHDIPTPIHPKKEFNLKKLTQQLAIIFTDRTLLSFNFSIFMSHLLLTANFLALPIFFSKNTQLPLNQQWQIYLPIFIISICFIGYFMRRDHFTQQEIPWLKRNILFFFMGQLMITLASNSIKINLYWLYLGLYLFLQSFTFLEALLPSLVSKSISMDFRGSAMGLFSTCQFLGIFFGGIWGGLLMQHMQLKGIFLGNTLLALLWLLVMLTLGFNKSSSQRNLYGSRHQ